MIQYQRFGVYIKTDRQSIQFPVNPQEISVTYGGDNTNYNLIGKGEVIIPRRPKLATVEISSFFPRNGYIVGTVADSWYKPEAYVRFIKTLQERRQVFQFIVNRWDSDSPMFDSSFSAIVQDFTITDRGGESGDVYFTLSVSEYRDTTPQRVEKVSEDIAADSTKLTVVDIRSVPNDEIVVGDTVTVSGPVYERDDQWEQAIDKTKSIASNVVGVVGRILPPSLVPEMNRVYVKGLGWVEKTDCVKGNTRNNVNRAQLIGGYNA